MKKKIIIAITCVVILGVLIGLAVYFGTRGKTKEEVIKPYRFDSELSTDPQILDNGSLKLEFNPETTQFTLTDKNGNLWYSTAQGTEASTRNELQAPIIVEYRDTKGVATILDCYKSSVQKGNYSYEVVDENTIRVDYTIGQIEKTYYVPSAITEERYNELAATLSEEGAKEMKGAYKILNYEKLKEDERKTYLELYSDLETTNIAILRDGTQEWKKENLEEHLMEGGYTQEAYEADQATYGVESVEDKPVINISVYYTLEGDDLVVKVPFDEIAFYNDYPLTELRVLPYMCSAGLEDEGYLFVPDGSGAMINFNNGKSNQTLYSAKIYGWDHAMVRQELISESEAEYPVYGISFTDTNKSMLCVVEDGESYGFIEADVAGRKHNYNYVTAVFNMVHYEKADVTSRSNAGVYLYENGLTKGGNIQLRYKTVDSSDYVDMAKTYQSYLLAKYPTLAEGVDGNLPIAVELIGAVNKTQQVLGFPKDLPYALSTYDEMAAMIEHLSEAGVANMTVILNGWFNDGVVHTIADNVDLVSELGSKKDFKKMLSTINSLSSKVYLKADFEFVYDNSLFDSYNTRKDTAKFVTREIVELKDTSHLFYAIDTYSDDFYLAKPSVIIETVESFMKEIEKYDNNNIAFNSIGNKLSADYNRKDTVSRQTAKDMQTEELAKLLENNTSMLFYEGNEYCLPYSDIIVDLAQKSQGSNIVDQEIPFFPIVLHGYVNYTGDAINITGDFVTNILKSAENGAGLYCVLMDAKTNELQDTEETKYFGANFDSWKDDIVTWYQRFETDFGGLYGQTITNHEIVDANITMTEYEDGSQVYVNYRTAAYTTESGVTIPAQDWVVVSGKGGN